ncbi:DNA polymerase III subunit gamma/tau [Pseudomonadota bacterium]
MENTQKNYQVLARKYRPSTFGELIGQDVLVRTLSNAIKMNRIAHSFILTGIRGIGKTTTARLIAKSLNCIGSDGVSKETVKACCTCDNCLSIAASNSQDVIEIDAASRTGVEGIREIIENVNYAPVSSRYKIYIIDEVHMLSTSAFNALLKTLEEPPVHVKFIFATTEIRKVPITILSRCQRFDLRRLTAEEITVHLKNIIKKEGFEAEDMALSLIANAAEGSVRDSLSLLDRVLSYKEEGRLTEDSVSKMLGVGERGKIIDFFEDILKGNTEQVLLDFNSFYENSVDIHTLLHDLLDVNHQISLAKTIANYKSVVNLPHEQINRIVEISKNVSLGSLAKIWQMLLKGINEINYAPGQRVAMEMLLIRICHASTLPNVKDIVAKMNTGEYISTSPESLSSGSKAVQRQSDFLSKNNGKKPDQKNNVQNSDLINDIFNQFSDAKIVD